MRRWLLLVAVALLASPAARGDAGSFVAPFERGTGFVPVNDVDACVLAGLAGAGIEPSNPCSDEVFLRRVFLDLTGTLPDPERVRRFLADPRREKRERLVDALLASDELSDYLTLKWGDLLRVKSEFPINLWPNAVQAYDRWILEAVRSNLPYDQLARALLTSSGSNFRDPAVNFYRAVQAKTPEAVAAAVALTFMGSRFERWPGDRQKGMAAFFSRIEWKRTLEWKEEIVLPDPAPAGPLSATFPDGRAVTIPADTDPRRVFADWLLSPGNPWFARAIANRVWSWFFGRGVVDEPDDLRDDNPPSNPALLACLAHDLVKDGYDLRKLFRRIVLSRTYQGSPIRRSDALEAAGLFAYYPVHRLDAEVLIDALCRLDDVGEDYASTVPEPYTILPNTLRTITLSDGTITSAFLQMFGRPARDSGLESERDRDPTEAQRLYLLNSSDVQRRLARSRWISRLVATAPDRNAIVEGLYLALLDRYPLPDEVEAASVYLDRADLTTREVAQDLAWALLNSKEFLYQH